MKKFFRFGVLCVLCFNMVMLSACGKDDKAEDDGIQIVESEPLNVPESITTDASVGGQAGESLKDDRNDTEDNALKSDAGMADNGKENVPGSQSYGEDVLKNSDESSKMTDVSEKETETGEDPFTGEYSDYDANEPNLEIQKNADETYRITIGIFRLAYFDDAVGMLTEKGLAFTATAPDGSEAAGVISLEGDIATVTFEPGWEGFDSNYSYKYYKTSDKPNF